MARARRVRVIYRLSDLDREEDGPMLTTDQVVGVLGIGFSTTRQLLRTKDIRSIYIGKRLFIPWVALRAYLVKCRALPLREDERPRRPA